MYKSNLETFNLFASVHKISSLNILRQKFYIKLITGTTLIKK